MNPSPFVSPAPVAARGYLCAGCSLPQGAPPQGGRVSCPSCGRQAQLPDRSALLAGPRTARSPSDTPERLQQLRQQDGRPRLVSPALTAVLGAAGVQPGREQEALAIWQSLRARSEQGDVAASEDLATLTLLLRQLPSSLSRPGFVEAITESALDAAVLPRHQGEQLGTLVRLAVARGDRGRAEQYLSWMRADAPELELDSEFRLSVAALATLDRDPRRVLALLGPRKDALPIADPLDPLASVFRAHALEMLGDLAAAQKVLGELPAPEAVDIIRARFAALGLCPRSAPAFTAATNQRAEGEAVKGAGTMGCLLGFIGVGAGALFAGIPLVVGLVNGDVTRQPIPVFLVMGSLWILVGIAGLLVSLAQTRRTAWLWKHGLRFEARIVLAEARGGAQNHVPRYRFSLQIAGPQGPYIVKFNQAMSDYHAAQQVGRAFHVRVNPARLEDYILEK